MGGDGTEELMGTHWSRVTLPTLNLHHTLWCPEPLIFLPKLSPLSFSVPKVVPLWCEGDGWWLCVTWGEAALSML